MMLIQVKAQTLGEYVIMLSIVVAASAAMFPMIKRGTQSLIKTGADQIGDQSRSEQDFDSDDGYLIEANTFSSTDSTTKTFDRPGVIGKTDTQVLDSHTRMESDLGFTED